MYRCHLLLLRLNVSPPIQLLQTQTKIPSNIADDALYNTLPALFTPYIINNNKRVVEHSWRHFMIFI